jgi:TPR repeat protein
MACYDLAEMVERGIGVRGASSTARALALWARACDLGEHLGCDMAAVEHPDPALQAAFGRKSVALDARQCAGGDGYACYLLSYNQRTGEKVKKDAKAAEVALARSVAIDEKGCAGGDRDACRRLAHEVDPARGRALWTDAVAADVKSCEAGDPARCMAAGSCHSVGASAFGLAPDPARGAELFARACAAGWAQGCRAAAADLREAKAAPGRVAAMWDGACRAGDDEACQRAFEADPAGMADRGARALELRAGRCDAGNALGCQDAAEQLRLGRGVTRDLPRAAALDLRACRLGARWKCVRPSASSTR